MNDMQSKIEATLRRVMDPELPFLSIVDLGMIDELKVDDCGNVSIVILPTFAGCPALQWIQHNIRSAVENVEGVRSVNVEVSLRKAWSTNRMTDEARRKLRDKGIAPPHRYRGELNVKTLTHPIPCPHCGSSQTQLRSPFGPALCRAFYQCNECGQTFERFKPV